MAASKPHEVRVVHLFNIEVELAQLLTDGWSVLSLRQFGDGKQWVCVVSRPVP